MKTDYSQIASNMRACGIREDWCAAVEAADGFRDALEFYADGENWREEETGIGMAPGEAMDYGAKACRALAKAQKPS